ncbi:hypothetical protein D3C83_36060 [compost metagenome]
MLARLRALHRHLGVQAARRGEHHHVGVGLLQEILVALEGLGVRGRLRRLERLVVDVADGDEFRALRVLLQGLDVVLRNAAAADEGEADFAAGDRLEALQAKPPGSRETRSPPPLTGGQIPF